MVRRKGRPGGDPGADLLGRYERAIRLARDWMARHHAPLSELARIIPIDPSVLLRFVNRDDAFTPRPSRHRMMWLLERIEERFGIWDLVREEPLCEPREDEPTQDEDLWFNYIRLRLRFLRNQLDPVPALLLLPILCVEAEIAPPARRFQVALDSILTYASRVSSPGARQATRSLIFRSIDRIRRLEGLALASPIGPTQRAILHRPRGYAGTAITFCGLLLGSPGHVSEGLERLLDAARQPHDIEDGHWPNIFRVLERMFEDDYVEVRAWSERAARLAATEPVQPTVRYVLDTRTFERVRSHWKSIVPMLMQRGGPTSEDTHA